MKQSSIKKNFIYNVLYQVLIIIVPLITSPYLTRTVGADGLGIYSYTQAYAHYFVLFILLGLNNYGNREIAKVRDDKKKVSETFFEIYSFQLINLIFISIIYIFTIILVIKENRTIYWIQFLYVLSAGFDINWCCFGLEKFKLTVTRNSIIKIGSAIAIFLFVHSPNDLWIYTLIIAGTTLLSQVVVWPFVLKEIDFIKPSIQGIVSRIKPNIMLFLPVIAVSLYTIMDKLMLGLLDTKKEVAYYAYAERIIQIPLSFITALGTVMLPRASHMMHNGKSKESIKLLVHSMQFAMVLSIGSTAGVMAISNILIPWYYGKAFTRCAIFTCLLAPVIAFTSWNTIIRTQFVIPKGLDQIYLATVSSGAVVNLVLNYFLIKSMRGTGAVIATIFAELAVCLVQYIFLKKELNYKTFAIDTGAFVGCGVIMAILVYAIPVNNKYLIYCIIGKVFIGIICYSSLVYIYLIKIKKDYWLVHNIINMVKKK